MNRTDSRRRDAARSADRRDDKTENKVTRTDAKVSLVEAKALKAEMVARKRKWLVILIGIGLAAYYAITSGGLNLGGLLEKVKGVIN